MFKFSSDILPPFSFLVSLFVMEVYSLTCSIALGKLFYPVLNKLVDGHLSSSNEQFPNKHRIEGLQRLLYSTAKNDTPLSKFVEKLSWELESFIVEINKQFSFHEIEVHRFYC